MSAVFTARGPFRFAPESKERFSPALSLLVPSAGNEPMTKKTRRALAK
jgi:hypothetical protein